MRPSRKLPADRQSRLRRFYPSLHCQPPPSCTPQRRTGAAASAASTRAHIATPSRAPRPHDGQAQPHPSILQTPGGQAKPHPPPSPPQAYLRAGAPVPPGAAQRPPAGLSPPSFPLSTTMSARRGRRLPRLHHQASHRAHSAERRSRNRCPRPTHDVRCASPTRCKQKPGTSPPRTGFSYLILSHESIALPPAQNALPSSAFSTSVSPTYRSFSENTASCFSISRKKILSPSQMGSS